jgi:hypothetical protein
MDIKTEAFLALKALEAIKNLSEIVETLSSDKVSRAQKRVLQRKARIIKENLPIIAGDLSSILRKRKVLRRIDRATLEEEHTDK